MHVSKMVLILLNLLLSSLFSCTPFSPFLPTENPVVDRARQYDGHMAHGFLF